MPKNSEWSKKSVDPGKSAGLGFQTRSLHEALALLALVSSKR